MKTANEVKSKGRNHS